MLLLNRIISGHVWLYYSLLLLGFHLWHCQGVKSQAENILHRVKEVKRSLDNQYLTNRDFCQQKNCQNQQQMVKKLFEAKLRQFDYSYVTLLEECTSIYASGSTSSGIYPIWLKERFQFSYVYCDMDLVSTKKGWTTIQRRMNGKVNFERGWDDYVRGFGNPSSEHWLGLENIYRLSRQTRFSINILGPINIKLPEVGFDLEDWQGVKAFVQYRKFLLESRSHEYNLNVNGLDDAFEFVFDNSPIIGYKFSTPDRDNDDNNHRYCAREYKSGWWFRSCAEPNLNGPYPKYNQPMRWNNIYWFGWSTWSSSKIALRVVSMNFYHGSADTRK